jgi:tetratricopeptide (TPR) repeat protein
MSREQRPSTLREVTRAGVDSAGETHYRKGCEAIDRGDWDVALGELRFAVLAGRTDPITRGQFARALRHAGCRAEAVAEVDRALGSLPTGGTATWLHLIAAECLAELGDQDSALRHLRAATRESPGDTRTAGWLAGTLAQKGDFRGAAVAARALVELVPDDGNAWASLAEYLAFGGEWVEARQAYVEALRLGADGLTVLRGHAAVLAWLGDLEAAQDAVRAAIRLWERGGCRGAPPESVPSLVARTDPGTACEQAALLQERGRDDEAIRTARQALAVTRSDLDRTWLHSCCAASCRALGRYEEALEHALLAVEAAPDEPRQLFNLAIAYRDVGDPVAARLAARRTLALDPGHASARFLLGQIEMDLELFDESEQSLRPLLGGAEEPGALYSLVEILCRAGRSDEAERLIEERHQAVGPSPSLFAALARLRRMQGRMRDADAALRRGRELGAEDAWLAWEEERSSEETSAGEKGDEAAG